MVTLSGEGEGEGVFNLILWKTHMHNLVLERVNFTDCPMIDGDDLLPTVAGSFVNWVLNSLFPLSLR